MNARPWLIPGWFEFRANARLGIALLAAAALHAAVIFAVDVEWRAQSAPETGADIVLHLHSALPFVPAAADAGTAGTADNPVRQPPAGTPRTDPERFATPPSAATSEQRPESIAAETPAPAAAPPGFPQSTAPDRPSAVAGHRYADLAKAVAQAHALRERQPEAAVAATRTRRLTGASSKTSVEAAYLEMWRQKVQRIGRANYPPGGLSGELMLLAVIRHDGTLEACRVLETSGIAALDEAALRIVRLAAPYSHFPVEMRKSYDRLELVRVWKFARDGAFP